MSSERCSQILTVGMYTRLTRDLVLLIGGHEFSAMFSDPHCRYTRLTGDLVFTDWWP